MAFPQPKVRRLAGATVGICVLVALALPAQAAPRSKEALHFRFELGESDPIQVSGWIDEKPGTNKGYDTIAIDLDGDGNADRLQPIRSAAPEGASGPGAVEVRRGKTVWLLEFHDILRGRPSKVNGEIRTSLRWSVTTPEASASFASGEIRLYTSARAAREAPPIRLGRPIRLKANGSTRAAEAFVRMGLEDANGCTLKSFTRGGKTIRPRVRLIDTALRERLSTHADYG